MAPDKRVSVDFAGGVERDGAVDLAGEADAGNFFGTNAGFLQSFLYGDPAGAPPVEWILLGPAGLWRGERDVLFGAGGDHAAGGVHDQSASAAGANVDAEEIDVGSPYEKQPKSLNKTFVHESMTS